MTIPLWELMLRLFLSALVGGIVGYEREVMGKAAGIRTHLLVSLGSALFMSLAFAFPKEFDPIRIIAGVITGIGFLGAGAIFREGLAIRGLTSAATIWMTCALGLGLAIGFYLPVLFALFLVLLTLRFLARLEERVPKKREFTITSTVRLKPDGLTDLFSYFQRSGIKVEEVEESSAGGENVWKFRIAVPYHIPLEEIMKVLQGLSISFALSLERRT